MKQILSLLILIMTLLPSTLINAQCGSNGSFNISNSSLNWNGTSGSYTENSACSGPVTVSASFVGGAPTNVASVSGETIYIDQNGSGSTVSTFTYTFSSPATITSINVGDIDRSSTYTDRVRITVDNGETVSVDNTSSRVDIVGANNMSTVTVEATSGGANDNGFATFSTSGPVNQVVIEYIDQNPTNGQRFIFISASGTVCCPPPCNAGTNAPNLENSTNFIASSSTYTIPCGSSTADLTSLSPLNLPAGTSMTVHTGTPATDSNKISGTGLSAGTYYVSFYDATNSCYSPTTTINVVEEMNCCNAGNVAPTID